MKRSRYVTTIKKRSRFIPALLLATATIALTACGPSPEEKQLAELQRENAKLLAQLENQASPFTSPAQCQESGVDKEDCEAGYKAALEAHRAEAPRYSSLQECIAIYGKDKCEPSNDGSGSFMPFFMGYMMGGGMDYDRSRGYRYGVTPVYRDSKGLYRSRTGGATTKPAYRPSTTVASPKMTQTVRSAQGRVATTSKGGFGSSGSSRGSFSAGG